MLKSIVGYLLVQRSTWAAILGAGAAYINLDTNDPMIEQALEVIVGGGGTAVLAQLTYWIKLKGAKATIAKLLGAAMPIGYAVAQALGMTPEESANFATLLGGLAGALLGWSGWTANTVMEAPTGAVAPRNPRNR